MDVSVVVPALGESITDAIISQWLVKEGDWVDQDQPIVELETDKVAVVVNAPKAGVIKALLKERDDEVAVGDAIATIDDAAEKRDDAPVPVEEASTPSGTSPKMGPAASRVVEERGLDARAIEATGPRGHITKGDALAAQAPAAPAAPAPAKAAPPAPAPAGPAGTKIEGEEEEEHVPMRRLRKKIAERLVNVQQTAAILTTFNEVDMTEIMRLRKEYREVFLKKYGIKLGFMSFFVKAVIEALKAYPLLNAEVREDTIVYKNYFHVGVAVGGGRGLVVPVIRHADKMSFAEVEQEIVRLAMLAKTDKLTLNDLTGGTFTISNGGIYGSMMSTPILNAPQSGILGMHNIVDRPVVVDGEIVIRPMMYLALSYDHRIIDGREAVGFLIRIKEGLENPERLLLEV